MPYAAKVFLRFSALILNCREECLTELACRGGDHVAFHQQHYMS